MKTIRVTLSDDAVKVFNEIMYSLPKHEDGTGMCTQSQAVSYAFETLGLFEKEMDCDIPTFLNRKNELTLEEIGKKAKEVIPEDLYEDHSGYTTIEDANSDKRLLFMQGMLLGIKLLKNGTD